MRKTTTLFFTALVLLTGISLFESCRKIEDITPQHTDEDNNISQEGASPSTAAIPDFSTITWGNAKVQPVGTHEVHGDVVNNKLYIFGGFDVYRRPYGLSVPTKRAFVYDPVTNTWAAIKDMPHTPSGSNFGGVSHFGLTNDGQNIYFAGGYPANTNGTGSTFGTKQVWKYNTLTDTYTALPDLPIALAAGQLKYLNGKIHYMGGADLARKDTNIHLALDVNNPGAGWKPLAPLNNATNHPGAAVLGGKIYFVAGSHHQDSHAEPQKTLEVYDDVTDKWTNLAEMPVGVDHISSAVIAFGDRLLVLGGETSFNVWSKQVAAYSPATNTWTTLTPLPVARSGGVAAALNGNIYYVGGNYSTENRKGVPVFNTVVKNVAPIADAFVRTGIYGTTNYGNNTALEVKGSGGDNGRGSLLKFSLAGINNISTAKLRIYGYNTENANTITLSCKGVNNDSWPEYGITYNNATAGSGTGALTGVISTSNVNNQPKYIEFNVTEYVKTQLSGDQRVSLLLVDEGFKNTLVQFNSRENTGNKPTLVLTTY